MTIEEIEVSKIKPYDKNPRDNNDAVDAVAASLKEFGWQQPIVVDKNNVVIAGHTRLKAAKKLKMKTAPCVRAEQLTEEQVNAYRLADNRVGELATWNGGLLAEELKAINEIDMSDFGFEFPQIEYLREEKTKETEGAEETEIESASDIINEYESKKQEFSERMAAGETIEEDEEYKAFVQKFEPKKTTDDCYTPPLVYEAVENWVADEYGVEKSCFVRPFYPGGNYQEYEYKATDIVVDNPPFSIISGICRYYSERGIKFFMFAPHLTICGIRTAHKVICGVHVIYENKAKVNTSFVTNLEKSEIRSAPTLYAAIKQAVNDTLKEQKKELSKYEYPLEVITSNMLAPYSRLGIDFHIMPEECMRISELDAQKECGKGIFGSGYLISEEKAAEREKAEREKAEREKAEREKAEREKAEREKTERWQLSEREHDIIKSLTRSEVN